MPITDSKCWFEPPCTTYWRREKQRYRFVAFIWMITPKDFIDRRKNSIRIVKAIKSLILEHQKGNPSSFRLKVWLPFSSFHINYGNLVTLKDNYRESMNWKIFSFLVQLIVCAYFNEKLDFNHRSSVAERATEEDIGKEKSNKKRKKPRRRRLHLGERRKDDRLFTLFLSLSLS